MLSPSSLLHPHSQDGSWMDGGLSKPWVSGIESILEPCPESPGMEDLWVLTDLYSDALWAHPAQVQVGRLMGHSYPGAVRTPRLSLALWSCLGISQVLPPALVEAISPTACAVGSLCSCSHSGLTNSPSRYFLCLPLVKYTALLLDSFPCLRWLRV